MRRLTRRQRLAGIVLAVLAACLVTFDLGGGALAGAHGGVRGSLGALYRGTDSVLGPVRRYVQGLPSAGSNQARIDQLEHDNEQLRHQLAEDAADKSTQTQLAALKLAAKQLDSRVLPARVIAIGSGAGFDWTVTLDAGSGSGIRVGMTVTDGYGLVGRVLHADSSTSVVLLAADPRSGVGARDLRSGQVGVVNGAGTSGFTFVPLSSSASLKVGDQLSTGPSQESSFVAGIAIGTVRSVRVSADGTEQAAVTPAASPTGLDLVGVVLTGADTGTSRSGVTDSGTLAGGGR